VSFGKMKSEKSLAHDDFIAIIHRLAFARFQSAAAVHERAIGGSEILNDVLSVFAGNPRVTARNFCFGIVRVQINVRKDTAVGVPTPDVGTSDLPRSIVRVAFCPAIATAPALCCATMLETGGFAGRATVRDISLLPPSLPLA
jgi:hypothetical protein